MRQQRAKWKAAIRRWQKKLLLDGYAITIEYIKDGEEIEGSSDLPSSSWGWVAKAEIKPMYLQARLKVADSFLRNASDDDIDTKAAHELIHVLIGQIDDFVSNLVAELPNSRRQGYWDWWHRVNEFTATHIARVVGARNGS